MGVEAGADGRATDGRGLYRPASSVLDLSRWPKSSWATQPLILLAERDRRRVLQVGAADLHDIAVGVRFRRQRVAQPSSRRPY